LAPFHQIAGQLARLRYRSDGRFTTPIVVRAPFGGGSNMVHSHQLFVEAADGLEKSGYPAHRRATAQTRAVVVPLMSLKLFNSAATRKE
jgi:hypothetical protein